jgi:hypothetical protein
MFLPGFGLIAIADWSAKQREPRLYACQLYTYCCLHYTLSNLQPIKKRLMFLPEYGPIAIAAWLVNHYAMPSIDQTWALASIGAVIEMGDLIRTLKRLLMESSTERIPSIRRWSQSFSLFISLLKIRADFTTDFLRAACEVEILSLGLTPQYF